jgi:hypothetical protein
VTRYACRVRAWLVAILLFATPARADKPTLAALAPATDARRAIAIGPAGQLYEPDGKGDWVRTKAGGVAEEVTGATAAGNTVFAAAKGAPPFKLKAGAWTAVNLGLKPKAILGAGSRVLAAVGKSVFALDKPQPLKLADAPTPVTALAASPTAVVIQTDKGLMKLEGIVFKPIKKAPKTVRALISDRWALVDRGAFDLKAMKPFPWPAGVQIVEATTLGNDLIGVSMHGKTVELVTLKPGKTPKLVREAVPIDNPKPIVGLVIDKEARVTIAMRDGRIAWRDKGTWTVSEVREELAAPKPGPAPAESQ